MFSQQKITNTQYLKKGMLTNVGTVKEIHDNKGFTTSDGWYHDLDTQDVFKYEGDKQKSRAKLSTR